MIYEELIKQAGKKFRSTSWWTNSLLNELSSYQQKNINELDTNFIVPGDFVFFLYSAKYPQKYKFWDQHPLVYVMEVNPSEGLFLGSNVHYLNIKIREGVVSSYLNKDGIVNAPKITLHNYLFANVVTGFYKIPKEDWVKISSLPTESFVDKRGQKVPKYKVWSYSLSQSSP